MRNFAFDRVNFMLIGISMLIVIVGFILMSGGGSTEEKFSVLRLRGFLDAGVIFFVYSRIVIIPEPLAFPSPALPCS